jgi:hypothetical protein
MTVASSAPPGEVWEVEWARTVVSVVTVTFVVGSKLVVVVLVLVAAAAVWGP